MPSKVNIDLLERAEQEIKKTRASLLNAEAQGIDPVIIGVTEDLNRLIIRLREVVNRLKLSKALQDGDELDSASE